MRRRPARTFRQTITRALVAPALIVGSLAASYAAVDLAADAGLVARIAITQEGPAIEEPIEPGPYIEESLERDHCWGYDGIPMPDGAEAREVVTLEVSPMFWWFLTDFYYGKVYTWSKSPRDVDAALEQAVYGIDHGLEIAAFCDPTYTTR